MRKWVFGIAAAAALAVACPAWAVAPADEGLGPAPVSSLGTRPSVFHQMGTALVVHNWVVCAQEADAQNIANARMISAEAARRAYDTLAKQKMCGQVAEMQVILYARLYTVAVVYSKEEAASARVYSAAVHFSGVWASGFLVEGALPASH